MKNLEDHKSNLRPSTDLLFDLGQVSSSLHLSFFICKKKYTTAVPYKEELHITKNDYEIDFKLHQRTRLKY